MNHASDDVHLESQKPSPQLTSPHDSDTDEENKPTSPVLPGDALPFWRKCLILFVVSWMTLAVTFSSTSLLPATPEIATEFDTSTEILNVINAGVLIAMGFSSFIWGAYNQRLWTKDRVYCSSYRPLRMFSGDSSLH
ncbi:MFS transporter [Penicillium citrinum]|uniref:MFS transporter n=1 Tax=Penicillium citrinum TaxID=5077 RepID=A0A9W9TQC4_PENCI|nr:MFS transporter [Penicillium citrinum]KAJ5234383.1 MFS transporter [Penicillium citrinum]